MTSAHRPTLDPAKGKLAPETGIVYDRMLPGHTTLKVRQPGQGGVAGLSQAELNEITQSVSEASNAKTEPSPLNKQPKATLEEGKGSATPSESPEDSDSAYESDDEEELRKELQQLRQNKIVKQAQLPAKAKKRSWTDEAVFSNQSTTTTTAHYMNDSLHSQKSQKFIKKYIQ